MNRYWIVVADAGRAIVLSQSEENGKLNVEHEMTNPSGRMRTGELVSDQRGRVENKGFGVQSAMEPRTDQHERQAIKFARKVCKVVDEAVNRHAYESLVLFAPAHFLGLLQTRLGKVARRSMVLSQPRDLIHASLDELGEYVRGIISPAMTGK